MSYASEQGVLNAQYNAAVAAGLPSVIYRPRLFQDGNAWCALYGENSNIATGMCAFGDTPAEAMHNFDMAWNKKAVTVGDLTLTADATEQTEISANVVIERTINGEIVNITGGRSVFVGRMAGDDSVYIQFVSGEGKKTQICLSGEAANVLSSLLSGNETPGSEEASIELPGHAEWRWMLARVAEDLKVSEAAKAV